jgi:hypothetical protein
MRDKQPGRPGLPLIINHVDETDNENRISISGENGSLNMRII